MLIRLRTLMARLARWRLTALFHVTAALALVTIGATVMVTRSFTEHIRDTLLHQSDDVLMALHGQSILDAARGLDQWLVVAALVGALCAGPMHLFLLRNAIQRLRLITRVMNGLARGNADDVALAALRRIETLNGSDEISDMVQAVEVFRETSASLKLRRDELRLVNARFKVALNNMARGLSMFDGNEKLAVCNAKYREMYDLPEHLTRPGSDLTDLLEWRARAAPGDAAVPNIVARYRAAVQTRKSLRYTRSLADGRVIDVSLEPLQDGGWVTVHQDVTAERRAEEKIAALARQDPLTELANRRGLEDALQAASRRLSGDGVVADPELEFALLYIDLDHFKAVNDTYGHPTGDALLQRVSELLRAATRGDDVCARIGGDEFAILQNHARGRERVEALAQRLIAVLAAPIRAGEHTVTIGASIGIAMSDGHGKSATQLLSEADIALYWSKSNGRNRWRIFSTDVEAPIRERRQIESEMRPALEAGQFALNFQPIVSLADRRVYSCEALLRWRHPERGFVSPAEFIPLAEKNGFIHDLGRWVIDEACRIAVSWPSEVSVAVNLSPVQLQSPHLYEVISSALIRNRFHAHRFEIEITESAMLADDEATRELLMKLKALGVKIALDDFGTGYSSLRYLRAFPFDKLKIDQSFVRDISDRDDCVAIVKAVAGLASSLDMLTVAEGVETHDHLQRVHAAGCTQVQGYLFSRPVPEQEVAVMLATCAERLAA